MNHLEITWSGAEQPKMQLSSHSLESWHFLTPKVHLPQISFLSPGIRKVPHLSFSFLSQGISPGQAHLASHMHCGQRSLWHGWAELFWTSSYWRKTIARLGLSKIPLIYDIHSGACGMVRQMGESIPVSWPDMCIAFSCDQLTSYVHCIWLFIFFKDTQRIL